VDRMPSGVIASSVAYPRPAAALAAKDAKKRSVHDASWCVADVAHASASVARAERCAGETRDGRPPFLPPRPANDAKSKSPPRAAAPGPSRDTDHVSAAHCASAPSVVPAASACSGRGRSSDTSVGASALRVPQSLVATATTTMTQSEEIAGDATGNASRRRAVSFAICTPFTAASGMHGAMILSCAATVAYIAGGSPGDVTRATASAATNATAPTQSAAAATLVASASRSDRFRTSGASGPDAPRFAPAVILSAEKTDAKTLCSGPFRPPTATKKNTGSIEACACASAAHPTPKRAATSASRSRPSALHASASAPTALAAPSNDREPTPSRDSWSFIFVSVSGGSVSSRGGVSSSPCAASPATPGAAARRAPPRAEAPRDSKVAPPAPSTNRARPSEPGAVGARARAAHRCARRARRAATRATRAPRTEAARAARGAENEVSIAVTARRRDPEVKPTST